MKSLTYPNRQVQARARSVPRKQQQAKDKGDKKVVEFAVLRSSWEEQEEHEVGLSNSKWNAVNK